VQAASAINNAKRSEADGRRNSGRCAYPSGTLLEFTSGRRRIAQRLRLMWSLRYHQHGYHHHHQQQQQQ